jgi:hypothetical protein
VSHCISILSHHTFSLNHFTFTKSLHWVIPITISQQIITLAQWASNKSHCKTALPLFWDTKSAHLVATHPHWAITPAHESSTLYSQSLHRSSVSGTLALSGSKDVASWFWAKLLLVIFFRCTTTVCLCGCRSSDTATISCLSLVWKQRRQPYCVLIKLSAACCFTPRG